ncbi:MAG: division/cell wall cluster transcriptional repressor MraZ [Nitrospirae bacterium]|nr:division/cell wall cluster transcriptional repressor MraZ [Nitrospirota bacterium]
MDSFRGSFVHTIDSKGRLSIPSRFRQLLKEAYAADSLVLSHYDGCLRAFPLAVWEKMEDRNREKLDLLPFADPAAIRTIRSINANAQECEVDRLGRILVSRNLREAGDLRQDVVIVGMTTYFEIWARERWLAQLEKDREAAVSGGA